jgi:hypothetical protein
LAHSHETRSAGRKPCRHCGATNNPPKAYVCLTCFQILGAKHKRNFGHFRLSPGAKVLVACGIAGAVLYIVLSSWIAKVESRTKSDIRAVEQTSAMAEPTAPPVPPPVSDAAQTAPAN